MTAPSDEYLQVMRKMRERFAQEAVAVENYVTFLQDGIRRLSDTPQPPQTTNAELLAVADEDHG